MKPRQPMAQSAMDVESSEVGGTARSGLNDQNYWCNDVYVFVDVPIVSNALSGQQWSTKTKKFRAHSLDPNRDFGADRHTLAQAIAVSLDAQWKTAPPGWQEETCAHFRALHCLPSHEDDSMPEALGREKQLKTMRDARAGKTDSTQASSSEDVASMQVDGAEPSPFWNPSIRQNVFAAYHTDAVYLLIFLELFANEVYYRKLLDQQPVFVKEFRNEELTAINQQYIDERISETGQQQGDVLISFSSKIDHTLMYNILDSVHYDEEKKKCRSILECEAKHDLVAASIYSKLNSPWFAKNASDDTKGNYKLYTELRNGVEYLWWMTWQPYCLQASWGVPMAYGTNFEREKTEFNDFRLLSKDSALLPDRHTDLSVIHAMALCNLLRIPLTIYKLASQDSSTNQWKVTIAHQTDNTRPLKVDEPDKGVRAVWGTKVPPEQMTVYFNKTHGWSVSAQDNVQVPHVQLLELDFEPFEHAFKKNVNEPSTKLQRPLKVFTVLSPT
jgi:hypothetical protein